MKTLKDTPEIRAARLAAYKAGEYAFSVPPVCTAYWDETAWMNFVTFTNPELTGYLPPRGQL